MHIDVSSPDRLWRGQAISCREAVVPSIAEEIIGSSPMTRKLQKQVGFAAAENATALIQGEAGVGKEFVARVIHRHSDRAAKPFIVMNCSAIPADLLESELFGVVRSCSGRRDRSRRGRFREAQGGTILLDEIHDLTPTSQAKILRVLQTSEIVPLGGTPAKIDVRVVAATHVDLARRAADGRFRVDLYYRLSVLSLIVPPLRERHDDIPALARKLLAEIRPDPPASLSASADQALASYPWPGNVRELCNVLRRAAGPTSGPLIEAADLTLGPAPLQLLPPPGRLADILAEAEIGAIRAALVRASGNHSEAAHELGISRVTLYDRLKRHRIVVTNAFSKHSE